jgi:hypothetical protein
VIKTAVKKGLNLVPFVSAVSIRPYPFPMLGKEFWQNHYGQNHGECLAPASKK